MTSSSKPDSCHAHALTAIRAPAAIGMAAAAAPQQAQHWPESAGSPRRTEAQQQQLQEGDCLLGTLPGLCKALQLHSWDPNPCNRSPL